MVDERILDVKLVFECKFIFIILIKLYYDGIKLLKL